MILKTLNLNSIYFLRSIPTFLLFKKEKACVCVCIYINTIQIILTCLNLLKKYSMSFNTGATPVCCEVHHQQFILAVVEVLIKLFIHRKTSHMHLSLK